MVNRGQWLPALLLVAAIAVATGYPQLDTYNVLSPMNLCEKLCGQCGCVGMFLADDVCQCSCDTRECDPGYVNCTMGMLQVCDESDVDCEFPREQEYGPRVRTARGKCMECFQDHHHHHDECDHHHHKHKKHKKGSKIHLKIKGKLPDCCYFHGDGFGHLGHHHHHHHHQQQQIAKAAVKNNSQKPKETSKCEQPKVKCEPAKVQRRTQEPKSKPKPKPKPKPQAKPKPEINENKNPQCCNYGPTGIHCKNCHLHDGANQKKAEAAGAANKYAIKSKVPLPVKHVPAYGNQHAPPFDAPPAAPALGIKTHPVSGIRPPIVPGYRLHPPPAYGIPSPRPLHVAQPVQPTPYAVPVHPAHAFGLHPLGLYGVVPPQAHALHPTRLFAHVHEPISKLATHRKQSYRSPGEDLPDEEYPALNHESGPPYPLYFDKGPHGIDLPKKGYGHGGGYTYGYGAGHTHGSRGGFQYGGEFGHGPSHWGPKFGYDGRPSFGHSRGYNFGHGYSLGPNRGPSSGSSRGPSFGHGRGTSSERILSQFNLKGFDVHDFDGHDFDRHDFNGIDIDGLDFKGLDWKGLDLKGLDLKGLDLKGLDLKGLDLKGLDFNGNDMKGQHFDGLEFKGQNFNGLDMKGQNFDGFDFNGPNFNGFDHNGHNFNGFDFNGQNFDSTSHDFGKDDIFVKPDIFDLKHLHEFHHHKFLDHLLDKDAKKQQIHAKLHKIKMFILQLLFHHHFLSRSAADPVSSYTRANVGSPQYSHNVAPMVTDLRMNPASNCPK